MRFVSWFGALGVSATILITPLAAQEPTFGIGLGRSLGGPFSDPYIGAGPAAVGPRPTAWQLQTFSEWSPARSRFTFRAEALYSRLRVSADVDDWFGTIGSVLSPQPGAKGFQPYAIAGGAVFMNPGRQGSETEAGAPSAGWGWAPGLNAGAGFALDILSLRSGLEVRRHESVAGEDGSGWLSVSLLVRLP
jgi:hypothetical protein